MASTLALSLPSGTSGGLHNCSFLIGFLVGWEWHYLEVCLVGVGVACLLVLFLMKQLFSLFKIFTDCLVLIKEAILIVETGAPHRHKKREHESLASFPTNL